MKPLLVEDDRKIAAAIQRGLEGEGFVVEVSHDGDDGLWRASEQAFDLIILDLLLPRRNGYRVCADLRRQGVRTPILMLTAKDGELDEAEGLDTGADDYVTKPFSFPVLVARIRALLRRAGEHGPPPSVVGRLLVDATARQLWAGERRVGLTTREFDVLEFLVRRAGRVVSKAEVLAGVWSDDFEGDPNIVEVYVGRLRPKIVGSGASITTVRGAGYRLDED